MIARNPTLLLALLVALSACDGASAPPIEVDAGCAEPGTPADQPVIACPADVDLGCLEASGRAIDFATSVATCDGTPATVACTPAPGSIVVPGTTSARCVATSVGGATAACEFPIRYRVMGEPTIECAAEIVRACTAPRTPVDVPAASAMGSCRGGAVGAPTSDAPAAGFAVGTTDVTWTATIEGAAPLSCAVAVTIEDTTAPAIDCASAPTRIVRRSASDPIDIATPTATDLCDDELDVVVAPLPTTRGAHALTATATDDAANTGECTWTLDVVDAFAPTGLRVISAELAPDGSTDATLAWEPSAGADVTEVRLERADAEGGPFAPLATLPPATTTYTDADMPSPRAFYRVVALAGAIEGGTTAPVRALAIASDEYHVRDQAVASVPFATSLFGVVRHPVDLDAGPYPLVVFLHGNHGNCRPVGGGEDACATLTAHECTQPGFTTTPNAHGYVYLQETLAAQGYVTASLSANALNCQDDYIPQRTQLILEHLRRWATWSTTGGPPFAATFVGAVDLSRVALVGHSRGGEAVAAASQALTDTPIAGVTLASVFGIGPTDFHGPRPSGAPFAVLLPGCDADVRTLEGLRQYDRGLDPSDANARAQVLYVGANHNFFNSEWRFDDNAGRFAVCSGTELVGGAAQRGMLEVVLADWIASTTGGARLPAYVRAESATPASIDAWADRALDLRWSYAGASRRVIDDFLGTGAPGVNDLGGTNTYDGFTASLTCTGTCSGNFRHLVSAIRIAWQTAPAIATFAIGDVDASSYDVLSMRFASRIATINGTIPEHEIGIRVRDAAGTTAEVPLSSVGRLPHRYESTAEQEILTTVRVPLARLREAAPVLDTAHLAAIELAVPVPGGNAQGSVWVSDIELASD